jgi:hypothetical protein
MDNRHACPLVFPQSIGIGDRAGYWYVGSTQIRANSTLTIETAGGIIDVRWITDAV